MLENCDDAAPLFKFFNKNVSSHSNVALLVQTKTDELLFIEILMQFNFDPAASHIKDVVALPAITIGANINSQLS